MSELSDMPEKALKEMHLVTIVTERILKEDILDTLRTLGAKGFTLTEASGEGSRGIRASEWEGRNLKIESIVTSSVAKKIIEHIAQSYFENYAVIAYTHPVQVVRGEKYS